MRIPDDPIYQLIRSEKISEFNAKKPKGEIDFKNCDFRGLDLRELDAANINFSGAYFRAADLRGIDFRKSNLEGASLAGAKISGCYFPENIRIEEVVASQEKGTRMRVSS